MHNIVLRGYPNPPKNYYKVYVRSITYNQAAYIEDCMKGVAMQETNFPYVHHVIDDCSIDGEQDSIKNFLYEEGDMNNAEIYDNDLCSIIITKIKNNPNCTLVVYFLKRNMYGSPLKERLYYLWQNVCTYEAICEGDDYWIDRTKLQKQADFLDNNLEYGLCYTNCQRMNEKTKELTIEKSREGDVSYDTLLLGNRLTALTSLCRISLLQNYYAEVCPSQKGWLQGDYPKWLYFAYNSKIHCLEDCTACYRIVEGSICRPTTLEKKLAYIDSVYSIKLFYLDYFKGYNKLKSNIIADKYYYRARIYVQYKMYNKAFLELRKCPFNIKLFTRHIAKIVLNRP